MDDLDVMVIGTGGREYELARQMALSPKVKKVYVTPGNAGTGVMEKCENVAISHTDPPALAAFALEKKVDFAVLGMDSVIEAGVGDALRKAGILVFGPQRAAGRLEWSKAFAIDFMSRHGVPQPTPTIVHSLEEALEAIKDKAPNSYVIKADGLALGKGVVLPDTLEEADETLREMLGGTGFEGAGKDTVVVQERLSGEELSVFVVTDGKDFVLLPLTQDYKRIRNNDEGPNTGGVGSYLPVPITLVGDKARAKLRAIAKQTVDGMAKDGVPYQGVLFMGIMLAKERGGDPVVIEYNSRFGDPEAQILLLALSQSGIDVVDLLMKAARAELSQVNIPETLDVAALTVCLAAAGYPESPHKGDEIFGLEKSYDNVVVQHAGTKYEAGKWFTNGGRVVYVTGFGKDVDEAAAKAYAAIGEEGIHFEGMHYRTDIGHQARTSAPPLPKPGKANL